MQDNPYIFNGRLTKRVFMDLPKGCYLVSNTGYAPDIPMFAETLSTIEEREKVWIRLREQHLPGVRFYAYPDSKAYEVHRKPDIDRILKERARKSKT